MSNCVVKKVNAREGDAKFPSFCLVRSGKWTCVVVLIHNAIHGYFRVTGIYPNIPGDLIEWKELKNTTYNSKEELRTLVRNKMLEVQNGLTPGCKLVTVKVPAYKVTELKSFVAKLNEEKEHISEESLRQIMVERDKENILIFLKQTHVQAFDATLKYNQYTCVAVTEFGQVQKSCQISTKEKVYMVSEMLGIPVNWHE